MKKTLAMILVLLLALALMAGCGTSETAEEAASVPVMPDVTIDSLKTVGDAILYRDDTFDGSAVYEGLYVYVFELKDNMYRIFATIPEDVYQAIQDLDITNEGYQDKLDELVSPLPIDRYEDLTAMIPSQEELDQWIGKTGQDLLNDGWEPSGYVLSKMQFFMTKGLFDYTVTFEGKYDGDPEMPPDDFDEWEYVKPLVIKSVEYFGASRATDVDIG